MRWFRRPSPEYINITKPKTAEAEDRIPKDLWHKCPKCGFESLKKDFENNLCVCSSCNAHGRISANDRVRQLVDEETFREIDAAIVSIDPLKFEAKKKYREQYEDTRRKTGLNEAILSGRAEIGGVPVALAIMDFGFLGGSMGSVAGEKISRAMELSIKENIPCITITSTGGARMQEGILSLMQMAKTSILCAELEKRSIPFISILADPSTGGVMASFASLGDVVLAEPGALVGFAGKRVIEQTIKQALPKDFQTAEFQQKHGFVDMVVSRKQLRDTLIKLLRMFRKLPAHEGGDTLGSSAPLNPPTPVKSARASKAAAS
ncbi:acetyl-CoA carboxylase carboxyltransferase subunit beta [Candidatus Sumerlaeota bacterium]|nr:acetyl-CoA carboxylase carboxyltransferase subunit beta [Candidatus Sumerlaeota bacterium]